MLHVTQRFFFVYMCLYVKERERKREVGYHVFKQLNEEFRCKKNAYIFFKNLENAFCYGIMEDNSMLNL